MAPVALAVAADGSLFVGDYQLIRRIYVDGNITTVLDFGYCSVNSNIRCPKSTTVL